MKARHLFALPVVLGLTLAPLAAHADGPAPTPGTIAVLGIDSDEVQDQADALAEALKVRARKAPGWVLLDKSPSLGSLTTSLKCSAKPDVSCQQRIADTLKSDRYVWGVMSKAGGGGQVNVELHLFRRGKPDFVIRETYSDMLKDHNDAKLQGLAQRLFEELTGTSAGRLVVTAGTGGGEVIVDGGRKVPLEKGKASIELPSGHHTIEIVVPGSGRRAKQVDIQNGAEVVIDVDVAAPGEAPAKSTPFPTRTVVGGGLLVVGGALAVTSVVFGAKWIGLKGEESDLKAELEAARGKATSNNDYRGGDPCSDANLQRNVAGGTLTPPTGLSYCDKDRSAVTSSALAIGFGAGALVAGGIGAYLLFTKPATEPTTASRSNVGVQPIFGTTNGLSLSGSF